MSQRTERSTAGTTGPNNGSRRPHIMVRSRLNSRRVQQREVQASQQATEPSQRSEAGRLSTGPSQEVESSQHTARVTADSTGPDTAGSRVISKHSSHHVRPRKHRSRQRVTQTKQQSVESGVISASSVCHNMQHRPERLTPQSTHCQ